MSQRDGNVVTRWVAGSFIALGAHAALVLGFQAPERVHAAPLPVTEVELSPPSVPERPAPPRPEPATPPTAPESVSHVATSPKVVARAQNVLVAKPDPIAPPANEPVDFVTDPNGHGFTGSVVARGGTGRGEPGAQALARGPASSGPTLPPPRPKSDITPPADLSRRPNMAGGGCGGYYPRQADADSATVTAIVVVGPRGSAERVSLAGESPTGQGFGAAARACLRQSRFNPGLNKAGRAVKAVATVRVRFTR